MELFIIIIGILFSLFSTLVLSYVSIATMVGPWIAPTLVLLGHIIISFQWRKQDSSEASGTVACIQAIGAGGGIIATGVGFALPMLYFLDENSFNQWLNARWYFCAVLSALCIVAGGLGLWLGRRWSKSFLDEQQLPSPVSNLTHKIITSQAHPRQAKFLGLGVGLTLLVCLLRDGIGRFGAILSKVYHPFSSFIGNEFALSIGPSLWSIGFTVGPSIALPLLVGLVCKYIVLYPLANHAKYLPFSLFDQLPTETFAIAFCSGLVLCELLVHMPSYCKMLYKRIYAHVSFETPTKRAPQDERKQNPIDPGSPTKPTCARPEERGALRQASRRIRAQWKNFRQKNKDSISSAQAIEFACIMGSTIALLTYFNFSPVAQVLFIGFTVLATYSINQIGGKIGMIPFGRYSTFIVVPLMLLFNLDPIQATVTCVFFNICAASSSDLLFDYKTAQLCALDRKKMYQYQWIGLIATACTIGIFLWLLFSNLHLGSEAFFAQRGKAKALLLQSLNFDKYIVGMGILFGLVLKKFKINPTMVFGGLIMPNSISIGLIIGSLSSRLSKSPELFQPVCAGALAAESLWILLSIASKMV